MVESVNVQRGVVSTASQFNTASEGNSAIQSHASGVSLKKVALHVLVGGLVGSAQAQGAIYNPLNIPSGSICLGSVNPEVDHRFICVSPGNGPAVDFSKTIQPSNNYRGFGFASATRDYGTNIAIALNDKLPEFEPVKSENADLFQQTIDDGKTYQLAHCGDVVVHVTGDNASTESIINQKYADIKAAVDSIQGQKGPACVGPMTRQIVELSAAARPESAVKSAAAAALVAAAAGAFLA